MVTDSGTFHDMLDNSRLTTDPSIAFIPDSTAHFPLERKVPFTFREGHDTAFLTLYFAPTAPLDSHRIQLTLSSGPRVQASTVSFRLRPGTIDSIEIEDSLAVNDTAGRRPVDTIILTESSTGDSLYVRGFDVWGNRVVPDSVNGKPLFGADWSASGTLPPCRDSLGQGIYYQATPATVTQSGAVRALIIIGTKVYRDSVPVRIVPPMPLLVKAVTHDDNGNGIIDRIDCMFNKPLTIGRSELQNFAVTMPAMVPDDTLRIDDLAQTAVDECALYLHDSGNVVRRSSNRRPRGRRWSRSSIRRAFSTSLRPRQSTAARRDLAGDQARHGQQPRLGPHRGLVQR